MNSSTSVSHIVPWAGTHEINVQTKRPYWCHELERNNVITYHIAHETAIYHNPSIHSLLGTVTARQVLNRPTFKHVMFYENMRSKVFCGYRVFKEVVFVTQLSRNAGISVWRIVWVTTKCCFMCDMWVLFSCYKNESFGFKYRELIFFFKLNVVELVQYQECNIPHTWSD